MRKFTVISLTLSGKGNRIHRSGDVVSQDSVEANVDELVRGGYLQEVAAPAPKAEKVAAPVAPAPVTVEDDVDEVPTIKIESDPRPTIDEMTRVQIIDELKAMGTKVPHGANKATLYALL
jgi:hypothetical protein